MILKQIIVWSAVLMIGGVAAATDALAGGVSVGAQVPRPTIQAGALHYNIKPPHKTYFNGRPATVPQTANPAPPDFGASGPYVGLKYIGNQ